MLRVDMGIHGNMLTRHGSTYATKGGVGDKECRVRWWECVRGRECRRWWCEVNGGGSKDV